MITLRGNRIRICKYKLTNGDRVKYSNEIISGYEVEELDITNELWLDGKECESIQIAIEMASLGENYFIVQDLKQQLSDTDYQIIKCYEYQLANLELPYDIAELHTERQLLRDKINGVVS